LSGPTPTLPSQQSDTQTTPSVQSPAAAVPQIVSGAVSHSSVASSVASVHFKVRCERLGHGEDIYLVPIEDSESKYGTEDNDDATSMKLGVAAAAAQVVASEEELLKPLSPTHRHKMIPLYTTAQEYPWYSTLSSLPIPVVKKAPPPLPPGGGGGGATSPAGAGVGATSTTTTTTTRTLFAKKDQTTLSKDFRYRYAVFRAGVFFRWEEEMDENFISVDEDTTTTTNTSTNKTTAAMAAMDVEDNTVSTDTDTTTSKLNYHALPLRFLIAAETYVVNDVLGKRRGQRPDIYHKRPPTMSGGRHTSTQYVGVTGSGACEGTGRGGGGDVIGMGMHTAGGSQVSLGPTGAAGAVGGRNDSKASFQSEDSNGQPVKRKSVGFAPSPPSYADRPHPHQQQHQQQHEDGPSSKHHKARIGVGAGGADTVSLNSTEMGE